MLTAVIVLSGIAPVAGQDGPPPEDQAPEDTTAAAAPEEMPSIIQELPDYSGDLWSRSYLLGDWGGLRTDLANSGVLLDFDLEQTLQGNAHGGKDTTNAFRYSGSLDVRLRLDSARMGLWPGGLLELHGETLFGSFLNRKVGSPVNDDGLFPLPGDPEMMLPHVTFTQALSENFAVFVGKLDTTTGDKNEFAWLYSKDNFLHTSFRWNPVTARTTPYSTLGAGFVILNDWLQWSFVAYDTEGAPDEHGFDTVFDGGTTYATEARFTWKPFGLKGHQVFGFVYSDKLFASLDQDLRIGVRVPGGPLARLLTWDLSLERESGSWAFYYNFDQYVYVEPDDPSQGIGLFGRFGISDGEANPIGSFYSIGVGGKGVLPGRDQDKFGFGYFLTNWSDTSITRRFGIDRTQGVEMFYNIEVAPWLHITPDLQLIVDAGGVSDRDVAVVYGLRTHMRF
jgi:porin